MLASGVELFPDARVFLLTSSSFDALASFSSLIHPQADEELGYIRSRCRSSQGECGGAVAVVGFVFVLKGFSGGRPGHHVGGHFDDDEGIIGGEVFGEAHGEAAVGVDT